MMLEDGATADDIVRELVPPDPGKARRQLLVLGNDGRFAGYSGPQLPVGLHMTAQDFAVAGNIIATPAVLEQMARVAGVSSLPLASRLLHALELGQAAGGDRRGTRSACIMIGRDMVAVDNHSEPVRELARLWRQRTAPLSGPTMTELQPRQVQAFPVGGLM